MNPTVGQPLDPNSYHWRQAEYRGGESGAEWVREHSFGAEDWNFDCTQAVDGFLYGYGQGRVSEARRRESDRFDVLFYVRREDRTFHAAGLYLNAEYLDEREAAKTWKILRKKGIVGRRSAQIQAAFGDHTTQAAKAVAAFDTGDHVRWKVAVDDVHVFEGLPEITPLRPTDYRHTNAYDWTNHPWELMSLPDEDEPLTAMEGGLVTRVHRARERSAWFRRSILAKRKAAADGGPLVCEVCGFDAGRVYGPAMQDYVEAHHTKELAYFDHSDRVSEADIALLCANCHRAAHHTGRNTAVELKLLLQQCKIA